MEVFEHEHPLNLIDLEKKYAHEKEESDDDDENNDLAIYESFRCPCHRCGQEINQYHKYYYKCSKSCDYSIHKFCAEIPPTLKHTSHNAHILTLLQEMISWTCDICLNRHKPREICYRCSPCDFNVDISCAMVASKCKIHHPSHTHPLFPITRPITCKCDACGKIHQGTFYHCTTCSNFFIHSDCVSLPKILILKQTTYGAFSHTHPLTLSYSFPEVDQKEKHYPRCRVCDGSFDARNLWIYKCDKCWLYTHLDCATSRRKPFMSILSSTGLNKDFEDTTYPDLLSFPFPYETYNMLKHIFLKENGYQTFRKDEGNLRHMSHQHPLILVDTQCNDIAKPISSRMKLLSCHNPMKKIELLCNGCVRPITNIPFYKCANEDESCNFALHEWCTRLPDQVHNHPDHPQHTLVLLPNSQKLLGVFRCTICNLHCNGFVYSCVECDYHTDVGCAFIPEKIRHEAHPNHLIWRNQPSPNNNYKHCRSCLGCIWRFEFSFSCRTCDFDLHLECALFLPQTIRHKYDNHSLKLSYFPIENHKSIYFCEVCEEEFDPKRWFYHCSECAQSIHCACAPLILECERAIPSFYGKRYLYVNIKFGGIYNIEDHPHPLSFVQGIAADGNCSKCTYPLKHHLIFKCLQCKFAIHCKCS